MPAVFAEEGYQLLRKVKGKIIFRYHNITPAEFFKPYNEFHAFQCEAGRKQTTEFIREFKNAYWIADSSFNLEDLKDVKNDKKGICPPFNKIEIWANSKPDEGILRGLLESDEINLLFVGRVVPNKGYLKLLNILYVYALNYGKKIKLRIIGKFDEGLKKYNDEINCFINNNNLENLVEFIGEVNDSTLLSYYLGSDLLICVSEHEGFCVPIIEAQYLDLPVVALNACAVPETIGKGQLILDDDVKKFAAAIHIISQNKEYYQYLIRNAQENFLNRFSCQKISELFMHEFLKGVGKTI